MFHYFRRRTNDKARPPGPPATAYPRRSRNGGPGRLQRLVRHYPVVSKGNVVAAAPFFLLLDVSKNRIQIVIEFGGMGIANATHFIDDGIGFAHGFTLLSSSGVQMIGAL